MTVKYKTVITRAGAEKLAAATLPNGKKVNFAAMAVGDGGGKLPEPDASQTKLVNEVWRHTLNKISLDKKHKNYVVAELVIPPETGGFWLREMGLYDDTGALIAVGNMAESYKPELAEGSGRAQTLRMVIMVSDIDTVELSIDTTLVMATQDYVDDKLAEHEQSRRHPDATLKEKGFTQLSSATDSGSEALAATPKAVKVAYDLAKGKYTAQDATTAQKGIVQLSSATDSVSETLAATPKAVKVAYDLAKGKYTAQDATTTQKGIVQLSSATDSVSEVLAATPKAVKVAHDLAKGKYTAQDATTAQKGIVQLSSATDSVSEALAATPKAVKAANDNASGRVPSGRKVNGHSLAADISVTAQDIFNGQAVGIGNALDLNSYTVPGLYYQPNNAQALAGKNYPEALAGSLEVYKHAGITQIYRVYNNSRSYIRTLYGSVWSAWARQYDTANKPTAGDVGALPLSGGTISGQLTIRNGAPIIQLAETDTGKNYFIVLDGSGFRINEDSTGGNNILQYASGSKQLKTVGQYVPGSYANFDARYQLKNSAGKAANGWFKDASTGFMIQWGLAPGFNRAVNFPTAFPNVCNSITVTEITGHHGYDQNFRIGSITKTSFRIEGGSGSFPIYWQAVGY